MRRNYGKIERNITLSIRYSRLLEEISDTHRKNLSLEDKKGVETLKKRKIKNNNTYLDEVSAAIKAIETSYKPREYRIILDNELDRHLTRLSKHKYFEMVKHNIAINTVLDNSVDYLNTDDFLEVVSEQLFKDPSTMKNIRKKLGDLYLMFNEGARTSKTSAIASKIPGNISVAGSLLNDNAKFLLNPLAVKATLFAVKSGNRALKKRRLLKKLRVLSDTEFEYILILTLIRLAYAKEVLPEAQYEMYFKSKLKAINSTRERLTREFFEQKHNVKENLVKVNLLKTFDNYLIEDMRFYA